MPPDRFTAELTLYGPGRRQPPEVSPVEARRYCRQLARRHYENFTVASYLLRADLRQHFYNLYAYCRWADDLADEIDDRGDALKLIDWWEEQLRACYRERGSRAGAARHPVFVALAETIEQFGIPPEPFADLLVAFRQDQRTTRYETFDEVVEYCRHSANPVGRLVLHVGRCHDRPRAELADALCTGLQLANFCQDVARDWDRGRVYLPQEECRRFGYDESMFARRECNGAFRRLLAGEVARAERWLRRGWPLVGMVPRWLRLEVALFVCGGMAILKAIRRQDYDVWSARPALSKFDKLLILAECCWWPTVDGGRKRGGRWTVDGGRREEGDFDLCPPSTVRRQPSTAASYACCRRTARQAHSSFYPCFLLLPSAKRRAMEAIYAFMRHTDDLVDNRQPEATRRAALGQWRAMVTAALETCDDVCETAGDRPDFHKANLALLPCPNPDPGGALLPAVAHTVRQFRIPSEHFFAVIDGVEMDLNRRHYETFEELADYCHRVASAVGLVSMHVWGFRGEEAFLPARKCGVALQLTNILRDLKEDAQEGRCYLPVEDLKRCGYSAEELAAGALDERFFRLVKLETDRARSLYHEGAELIHWLEPDGRRIFGMLMATYYGLLQRIERDPSAVFRRRVGIPRWQRLALAGRWLLLPPRRSALP